MERGRKGGKGGMIRMRRVRGGKREEGRRERGGRKEGSEEKVRKRGSKKDILLNGVRSSVPETSLHRKWHWKTKRQDNRQPQNKIGKVTR